MKSFEEQPTEDECKEFYGILLQKSYDDIFYRFINLMIIPVTVAFGFALSFNSLKVDSIFYWGSSVLISSMTLYYGYRLGKRLKYRNRFISRISAISPSTDFYMIEVENSANILDSEFYNTAARKWVAEAQKGMKC